MWRVSGLAPLPSESKNSTAGVSVSATAEVTVYVHSVRCRTSAVAVPIVSGCVSTMTLPPQLVPARRDHASHGAAPARPGTLKKRGAHAAAGCGERAAAWAQARRERGRLGSGGGVRAVSSRLRDEDDFAGKRRERSGEPPATTSSVHNGVNHRCAIVPLACRKQCRVSEPYVASGNGARCCMPHACCNAT